MAHGVNATSVFSVTVTDTNDHFLPDTAGGADGYDVRQRDGETVVVSNDEDQDATVQLQGAAFDDAAMADAFDVGSSKTVARRRDRTAVGARRRAGVVPAREGQLRHRADRERRRDREVPHGQRRVI